MSYNPNRPVKTKQMIDRYHVHRRRQLLFFAGISLLVTVAVGGGIWLYLFFAAWDRSAAPASGGRPSAKHRTRQYARIAATYEFTPAPWFLATDDTQLYVGLDSTLTKPNAPPWPIDTLQAFAVQDKKPLWEWKQQHVFHYFTAANGMFFGLRQYLGEPPGFELTAFNGQDGKQAWQAHEDGAEDCGLSADSKVLVVAYYQAGAYRIVGYNAVSGAKAWVITLKASRLESEDLSTASDKLGFAVTQGVVTYSLDNHCGVIASGSGARLREIHAKDDVYSIQYDGTSKLAYVLSRDSQPQTYLLQAIPLNGSAVEMYRFTSSGESLLLGEQGYALLSYTTPGTDSQPGIQKIVCFAAGSSQPLMAVQYPDRAVWDMVALPTMPGEFLVSLCRSIDTNGKPNGECELHRVRVTDQAEWLLQRLPQPASLWPFKDDCLVLVQGSDPKDGAQKGGDLLSYRGAGRLKRLKHLEYPTLELTSVTLTRLVLSSYPAAYLTGEPGQPMQVIVLE